MNGPSWSSSSEQEPTRFLAADADESAGVARGYSRRAVLAGVGVAATAGSLSSASSVAAQGGVEVDVAFADEEISAGETTELDLTLSEVPEAGLNGVTIEVDLDGSVAELSGEYTLNSDWPQDFLDHEAPTENDSDGVMVLNTLGSDTPTPGATDVHLGALEVRPVGAGTTSAGVTVRSIEDRNGDEVDRTVGSDSLTVTGDDGEFQFGDDGSADDESSDDGGTADDESSDDGSADDGSADDGSADDGSSDDGSADDGSQDDDTSVGDSSDDSSDDSVPGFGVAAAATALLAGVGAKLELADRTGADETAE